jgi:hypothetical protein
MQVDYGKGEIVKHVCRYRHRVVTIGENPHSVVPAGRTSR